VEGVAAMMAVLDEARCDGCRSCLHTCTYHALLWVTSDRQVLIDPWACNGCGTCTTYCPSQAIRLVARARP
jgi:heterodisulfide reductase subunit A